MIFHFDTRIAMAFSLFYCIRCFDRSPLPSVKTRHRLKHLRHRLYVFRFGRTSSQETNLEAKFREGQPSRHRIELA